MREYVELSKAGRVRKWRKGLICNEDDDARHKDEEERITESVKVLRDETAVCKKSIDWPCVTDKLASSP